MKCRRLLHPTQLIKAFLGLFFFSVAISFAAQPANETLRPWDFVYDQAHEITVEATIQEVFSTHAPGTPSGLHLIVTTPEGIFDAHLGPFLTKETSDALRPGMALQIIGAFQEVHGKQYLLAREIRINGRTVTLRNQLGYLVRPLPTRAVSRSNQKLIQPEANGGAR